MHKPLFLAFVLLNLLSLNLCVDNDEASDDEGNTYIVGYDQVTSDNQNCFVKKEDSDSNQVFKEYLEESTVDCKGVVVSFDTDGNPLVVVTVDGGQNSNYITQLNVADDAFDGVVFPSYGSGGGPAISVLARINPENGEIMKGTFLKSQLSSGNTNTYKVTSIQPCANGDVVTYAQAFYSPPNTGASAGSWEAHPDTEEENKVDDESYFRSWLLLSEDFDEIKDSTINEEITCSGSGGNVGDSNEDTDDDASENDSEEDDNEDEDTADDDSGNGGSDSAGILKLSGVILMIIASIFM